VGENVPLPSFTEVKGVEFLAIEALLNLIGTLLPSMQSGPKKRASFLNAIFTKSLFSRAEELKAILLSVSNKDWEEVAMPSLIQQLSTICLSL
jgi:hypothetical protein